MIRAVFDTNQFVSSLIAMSGVQAKLLRTWRDGRFELVSSPLIIDEIQRVLNYPKIRRRYGLNPQQISFMVALIAEYATIVKGDTPLDIIRDDPPDNAILACALEAEAHYIVSGDRHLLSLSVFQGIPIVTGRRFLDEIMVVPPDP